MAYRNKECFTLVVKVDVPHITPLCQSRVKIVLAAQRVETRWRERQNSHEAKETQYHQDQKLHELSSIKKRI